MTILILTLLIVDKIFLIVMMFFFLRVLTHLIKEDVN
jgi:hypothetical protein